MKLAIKDIKLTRNDYKRAIGRAAIDSVLAITVLGLIAYFIIIVIQSI